MQDLKDTEVGFGREEGQAQKGNRKLGQGQLKL